MPGFDSSLPHCLAWSALRLRQKEHLARSYNRPRVLFTKIFGFPKTSSRFHTGLSCGYVLSLPQIDSLGLRASNRTRLGEIDTARFDIPSARTPAPAPSFGPKVSPAPRSVNVGRTGSAPNGARSNAISHEWRSEVEQRQPAWVIAILKILANRFERQLSAPQAGRGLENSPSYAPLGFSSRKVSKQGDPRSVLPDRMVFHCDFSASSGSSMRISDSSVIRLPAQRYTLCSLTI